MDFENELKELEMILEKSQKAYELLPKKRLRVSNQHSGQFFIFNDDSARWEYLSKSEKTLIQELAQSEYEEKIISEVKKQIKIISQFIKGYRKFFLQEIFNSIHPLKRALIKPHVLTDKEFLKDWINKPHFKNSIPIEKGYLTANGEKVRSKSEVIIADLLKQKGVPYKYECPLKMGKQIIYPDFTLMNIKTREEIYFEHFGMLDNQQYFEYFINKMKLYIAANLYGSQRFIFSFETKDCPLDRAYVEELIDSIFSFKPEKD